jgi:hypothetical protein
MGRMAAERAGCALCGCIRGTLRCRSPYPRCVRRTTPQEKKRLSLEKGRRNTYGENDKASRKNIPRAKARVNRAHRSMDRQILDNALGTPDPR